MPMHAVAPESAAKPAAPADLEIKDAQLIFNHVWRQLEAEYGREHLRFPKELILLGGDYRSQSKSLVGDLTIAGLHSIFSSITVLGINGVSIRKGCTTAVHQETSVNRAMIENSGGKVIVVADHTKMKCVSSFLTCPLSRIDTIVTDWMAPASFCQELEEAGLSVVQVSDEI